MIRARSQAMKVQKMENAKGKGADNQGHLLQVCTIKPFTLKVMFKKNFKRKNSNKIMVESFC